MNRRQALKATATLTAASMMSPLVFGGQSNRTFKVGACDWSLSRMLEPEVFRMGQLLGLDGIQYSFDATGRGWDLRTRENREDIRKVVQSTGVGIASLAIGLLNNVPLATTDRGEEIVLECMDAMVAMKKEAAGLDDKKLAAKVAPDTVLLAFFAAGDINGQKSLLDATVEKLKRIAPVAEKNGLILGIESWLSEKDLRYIMDKVDSPALKVYYDVANANKMGYDIYQEIRSLGSDNICQIHCKENGYLLGEGLVDFKKLKRAIHDIGYTDWLIIEGAVPKGTDLTLAYQHNVKYVQDLFNS